jgi:protein involved in polysaccharide export with SLBB domain
MKSQRSNHLSLYATSTLAAAMFFSGACNVAPKALPATQAAPVAQDKLTLRPGDKVEIKFYSAPELNDSQQIRPDGKITLQIVGDIQAAGRSPGELSTDLQTAFTNQLKYPQVTVIVREMYQRRVYITGEVERPGLVELPGDMSVLEAVMASGGFNMTTAEISSVIVMRHDSAGNRVGYKVDLRDAIAGGTTPNFMLAPQDIIFVPRAPIINVNNFLELYVKNVIPQTGFIYTQRVGNDGTIGLDTSRN